MNTLPLVSIIIPVFKAEKYIRNTIESALSQSYKNIEIICVIDCSPDNSLNICVEMANQNSCIKVYQNVDERGIVANSHLGQEAARNYGLDLADGDYFLFLDADDTLAYNAIQDCIEKAEKHNVDMVMFSYSMIRQNMDCPVNSGVEEKIYSVGEFANLLLNPISWNMLSCVGNKLYKSKKYKGRLYFNKQYKFNEDCAYAIEALLGTDRLYYMDIPYYKYLIRESGSIMSSYRPNMFDTNRKVVELLQELFQKTHCYNKKQSEYYEQLFSLMINSLINEKEYGLKEKFVKTVDEIVGYKDFLTVYKYICDQYTVVSWKKCIVIMLKYKKYNFIYNALKIRSIIKKENILEYFVLRVKCEVWNWIYGLNFATDSKSRIYMFHDISKNYTDPDSYVSSKNGLELFLQKECGQRKPVDIRKILDEENAFAISFDDGYRGVFEYAYPVLKKMNIPFTVFITYMFLDKDGYMTKKQLSIMKNDRLCTIGSHTMTHKMLRYDENAKYEIKSGKKKLEELLERKVTVFAYPYGSVYACSKRNIKDVKKAGFEMGFSAVNGVINGITKYERFFLPRIDGDYEVKRLEESNDKL